MGNHYLFRHFVHFCTFEFFFTFPYRKDHFPESTQFAGVQRGGQRWHSLRCRQLSTTDHFLEAQGLQNPSVQRWWAHAIEEKKKKKKKNSKPFLCSSCLLLTSDPPCSPIHLTPWAVPSPSCQCRLPVSAFQSIFYTLSKSPTPLPCYLWTKPSIYCRRLL